VDFDGFLLTLEGHFELEMDAGGLLWTGKNEECRRGTREDFGYLSASNSTSCFLGFIGLICRIIRIFRATGAGLGDHF
jgi:hypothetical protein